MAFIAFLENPIPYPYVPRQSHTGTAPTHWLKFASGGDTHDGISGDLIETVRSQRLFVVSEAWRIGREADGRGI